MKLPLLITSLLLFNISAFAHPNTMTNANGLNLIVATSAQQSPDQIAQAVAAKLASLPLNLSQPITVNIVSSPQIYTTQPTNHITDQTIIQQYGYDALNCITKTKHIGSKFVTEYRNEDGKPYYFRDQYSLSNALGNDKRRSLNSLYLQPKTAPMEKPTITHQLLNH